MRYKLLGKSGLRVSELCLGTMTFGDVWQDWGLATSKDECRQIFDGFADAGGNFIDTANNYNEGKSESLLGEFIESDRDHFVVATKYTLSTREGDPNACGNHRKNMARALEASLKRLKTDYIDLYWVHAWDFMTPVEEVMRGLDDMVRAGKVLYLGISRHAGVDCGAGQHPRPSARLEPVRCIADRIQPCAARPGTRPDPDGARL